MNQRHPEQINAPMMSKSAEMMAPIRVALARLDSALERFDKTVARLEDRLSPVLAQGPGQTTPGPQPADDGHSALYGCIHSRAVAVERFVDDLDSMTDKLEI